MEITTATPQHRTTATMPQPHKTTHDRTTKGAIIEEVAITTGVVRTIIETTMGKEETTKIDNSKQQLLHKAVFSIMEQIPYGLISYSYKTVSCL